MQLKGKLLHLRYLFEEILFNHNISGEVVLMDRLPDDLLLEAEVDRSYFHKPPK
jgi:hypothetical protein